VAEKKRDEDGIRQTWAWWVQSHETVLTQVRNTEWPARPLDVETLAGRLAGDEFHSRINAPGTRDGMTPKGWFEALIEMAMAAMTADLGENGTSWQRLWAFCCGLADKDVAEQLATEADKFDGLGVAPDPTVPLSWYQPAQDGDVLVARDAYGDRFLLAAPFSDLARPAAADHWYAWDIDSCGIEMVVAGGAHDSADSALAEWRQAVGPAAAASGFSPCPPQLGVRLLDPAHNNPIQLECVDGEEPAEFFREILRLSRRAADLSSYFTRRLHQEPARASAEERDAAINDFLDQHAARHRRGSGPGSGPGYDLLATEHALDLLLNEWGPDVPPDEQAFFACSPHRIEACTDLMRDSYEPEAVNEALLLLPDWVQWCARRIGLDDEFTQRAVAAARAELPVPARGDQEGWQREYYVAREREAPFRRQE
jgi:hypothetical protein